MKQKNLYTWSGKESVMGKYLEKKEVKDALKKAREIEQQRIMTPEEEVAIQKEAVSLSEKLKKLLAPEWFVRGVAKKKTKLVSEGKSAEKVLKKAKKKTKKNK